MEAAPDDETPKLPDSFGGRLNELLANEKSLEALDLIKNVDNQMQVIENCSDLINIVMPYLSDKNLAQHYAFHNVCENILIEIAKLGHQIDAVLELIEIIDSTKVDNTVISAMKALQEALLKPLDPDSRSLEWALNSVQQYASELPLSRQLRNSLDVEEEKLLEEDVEVKRIVSFYIFAVNFVEPILKNVINNELPNNSHFRNNGLTQRNILACFIIQMFGVPFAYLNLSDPTANANKEEGYTLTNVHARENVARLVLNLRKVIENPIQLIGLGHRRALHPYAFSESEDLEQYTEMPSDIFLLDVKVSITSMAVMFYALLVENLFESHRLKIYRGIYLFEMGLYFVTNLFASEEQALHTKGIRLANKLLANLEDELLEDDTLELDIHKQFGKQLIKMVDSTSVQRNGQMGVDLLQQYIGQFKSTSAQYFQIQYLLGLTTNNRVRGILITIYKNLLAVELNAVDKGIQPEVSPYCRGEKLIWLLTNRIYITSKSVRTDILQQNDVIMAALNMLRFVALRDKTNETKIWDYMDDIKRDFLDVLKKSLDATRVEYRLEEQRIQSKSTDGVDFELNADGEYMNLTHENRKQMLAIGQNTADLMDNLLSRLDEIIIDHRVKN